MPPPQRRITLRDIARRAGVHFTTVSLALRNHPRLPAATCAKVQAVARELGYVPDPMLASLSSYRTSIRPVGYHATLAWVTSFLEKDGWKKIEIFAENRAGAAERAEALGYKLEDFWLREPGLNAARATQILRARNINGLIVAPLPEPQGELELDWALFSAVGIGYSLTRPNLHTVSPHQYRCIRLALHEAERRGHRRPGMVMLRSSDDRVDHKWLAGYLVVEHDKPAPERVPPLLLDAWDDKVFAAWFAKHRPDAVITKCPEAWRALRAARVAVPRDAGLALVSAAHPGEQVSGVDENPRLVGAAAVDFVVGMLHRNERGVPAVPHRLLIEGTWVEGRTLRAAPAAARQSTV